MHRRLWTVAVAALVAPLAAVAPARAAVTPVAQDIETFDVAANGPLSNRTTGITGLTGFSQPLDVTQDLNTGHLYVTELGASRITPLRARP